MEVLQQSNIMCIVERMDDEICAKTLLVDRDWEVEAQLFVDLHTYQIKNATWQVLKGKEEHGTDLQTVDVLIGLSGYIQGKRELKRLLDKPCGTMMKYLFTECIDGLIQGETCVYEERGYECEEDYNHYWDELEKNGCRMYSHITADDKDWLDYADPRCRKKNLFNRIKSCHVVDYGAKTNVARGMFSDSYHELNIEIGFHEETGIILSCEIFFSRAPGKACFGNQIHKVMLIGKSIYEMQKIDVIDLLGRGEGCYHLVDITLDLLRLVNNRT